MVDKPAGLYLEDAINAERRDNIPRDNRSVNPRTTSPSSHGALRPTVMVRASDYEAVSESSPFVPSVRAGVLLASLVQARQASAPSRSHAQAILYPPRHGLPAHSDTPQRRRIGQPRPVHDNISRIANHAPEVLYAQLDSGFVFECFVSRRESNSYISQDLYQQIQPRPVLVPARPGARLRFNGEVYTSVGFATFTMSMISPDDTTKQVEICVTANVVVDLCPDMFLGGGP